MHFCINNKTQHFGIKISELSQLLSNLTLLIWWSFYALEFYSSFFNDFFSQSNLRENKNIYLKKTY